MQLWKPAICFKAHVRFYKLRVEFSLIRRWRFFEVREKTATGGMCDVRRSNINWMDNETRNYKRYTNSNMPIVGRDGCTLAAPERRLRTRRQFLVGAFVAVVRAAAAAQLAEHTRAEFAQADQNREAEQRGERRRRDLIDELFEEARARVAVVREHREQCGRQAERALHQSDRDRQQHRTRDAEFEAHAARAEGVRRRHLLGAEVGLRILNAQAGLLVAVLLLAARAVGARRAARRVRTRALDVQLILRWAALRRYIGRNGHHESDHPVLRRVSSGRLRLVARERLVALKALVAPAPHRPRRRPVGPRAAQVRGALGPSPTADARRPVIPPDDEALDDEQHECHAEQQNGQHVHEQHDL